MKRILWGGTLVGVQLAALLFFTNTALAAGPNLVINGNLEVASSNPLIPSGWNRDSWGTLTRTFTYPVAGNGGGKAAKVQITNRTSGDAKWYFSHIAVTPGTAYTYSDDYLSTVSTKVVAEYKMSAGAPNKYVLIATSASSGSVWKSYTAQVTPPQGALTMSIARVILSVGSVTVDNVSVTGPTITPPPPPPATTTPGSFSEGMVTFSFDDSWASQYTAALPLLDAASIKATFFLTTEPIQGGWSAFINPTQANDYRVRGHEIAGHTVTHADLTLLSAQNLTNELINSKNYLQSITGVVPTTLAYPYGVYNSTVILAVKNAGYTSAREIDNEALNQTTSDKFALKGLILELNTPMSQIKTAIDNAKAKKQWLILGLHEVDNSGGQYTNTPGQLQEIINYVKANNIKTVTVREGSALMNP